MSDAIVMEGVTKTFGPKVAVDNFDLHVPENALYGFIGPNGAGKTTTIRMIMSIIFPDRGRLSVLGRKSAMESKDLIGYLPEERGVYRKMKVSSFIRYMGQLKGLDAHALKPRIVDWLDRVELGDVAHKKCEELSKGMQQKVQFIGSVIHEPQLLILDEPFSGLDPVNMRLMRELFLEQHARGATVIFSTHVMHQAEQLCDHMVMINEGKKVLDATMDEIRAQFDPRSVLVEPIEGGRGPAAFEAIHGVDRVEADGPAWELTLADGEDPGEVMSRALAAAPMRRIEMKRPTLEDVFIEIVGASVHDVERAYAEENRQVEEVSA